MAREPHSRDSGLWSWRFGNEGRLELQNYSRYHFKKLGNEPRPDFNADSNSLLILFGKRYLVRDLMQKVFPIVPRVFRQFREWIFQLFCLIKIMGLISRIHFDRKIILIEIGVK